MTRIEELEIAIDSLPEEEYSRFRRWFFEKDWEKWDKQIAEDSMSGKLDILTQEANQAKIDNKINNL
ncbi:hypothetical protein MUP95_10325 [bacterium]|nr:hypothetical protein [bacterium]